MNPLRTRPLLLALALTLAPLPLAAQWSLDSLSAPRKSLASTSDGQRIWFAGGRDGTVRSAVVDVLDTATGTWTSASLSAPRSELAATAVGPYVLVAGGSTSPTTSTAVVDVYDSTLGAPDDPLAWSTTTLSVARFALAATTVGTKAIFAGGARGGPGGSPIPSAVVDVYDSALGAPGDPLAWSTTTLSVARANLAPAAVGTLALFAGGIDGFSAVSTVDVYDDATGTWSTASLSQARMMETHAAATAGGRVYFAGGTVDLAPTLSDRIDVFDSLTSTWSTLTLSVPRASLSAASVGDLVLFAGGIVLTPAFDSSDVVDVLRASTGTWFEPARLSSKRHNLAPGVAGDRVLFAGGDEAPQIVATVDVLDCPVATSAVHAGRGMNADTIAPVDMVIGEPWSAPLSIGHDHGAGGLLLLEVRTAIVSQPRNLIRIPDRRSELLIAGPLLYSAAGSHDGVTGDVPATVIPADVTLLGLSWAAQYRVLGGGHADLSQAVFGTIGCP